jgi:hydrogenase expression/formation protein HypE
MEIGKVPNDLLKKIILDKIKHNRKEVLLRPNIGEDCCAIDFGDYICILSTDPITGAVNKIGRLAVHISCNDIASCGVEPLGILTTILAPAETTEQELDTVMGQICETANSLNVDILGGHTEITSSVNRFILTCTTVGRTLKGKMITTSGARPGDSLILTKSAGIEGTAVIAHDKADELTIRFGKDNVERAKNFINSISVVKEGIIAGEFGATAMHDVTEGGVLGAAWEVAEASGVGVVIEREKIPVEPETIKISSYYGIDPLKLISSGCMIIACSDGKGLVKELEKNNIKATIIGHMTEDTSKKIISGDTIKDLMQPEADELYKVVG